MKNFTRILICLLLCVFSFGLFGCGKPEAKSEVFSGKVVGNGGMVAQKGNYLYFVNGYQPSADMETKNDTYSVGALMVAKLDENGHIVVDKNGNISDSYLTIMSDKLCGFEATGLYIIGDYLYFTSPCQQNVYDSSKNEEVWAKDRVDFYRIKLDKSGNVERIYQSEVNNGNLQFAIYGNTDAYLMVYEKGKSLSKEPKNNALYRVDVKNNKTNMIAENVSSVVFSEEDSSVFFVQDQTNNYQLYQFDAVKNEKLEYEARESTFSIHSVKGGFIYIKSENYLERSKISEKSSFINVATVASFDSFYIDENTNIVCVTGNVIEVIVGASNDPILVATVNADEKINVIGIANSSFIYYDADNNIKSVDYSKAIRENNPVEVQTLKQISAIADSKLELDQNYLYFYQTVGSNKYLHRIVVSNSMNQEQQFVGVYNQDDVPVVENDNEE